MKRANPSFVGSAGLLVGVLGLAVLAGCATRSADVKPMPANPADFALWGCDRIHDESDHVQQQAAELAYAVDERAGHNIMALGLGVTVFWPALLAMRPQGLEAQELARYKGRYEELQAAASKQQCPPPSAALPASQAEKLPVALGEQMVYEVRTRARGPLTLQVLQVAALRRTGLELRADPATVVAEPATVATATRNPPPGGASAQPPVRAAAAPAVPSDQGQPGGTWFQDRAGNVVVAPDGALTWPHLLRSDMALGQVTAGDILLVGDPLTRARMRGQVVAVGPQLVAGRRFDVAVVELFGDAPGSDAYTRVEGALVIDRASGLLLRLDLRSANPVFQVQRRLLRVGPAAAP